MGQIQKIKDQVMGLSLTPFPKIRRFYCHLTDSHLYLSYKSIRKYSTIRQKSPGQNRRRNVYLDNLNHGKYNQHQLPEKNCWIINSTKKKSVEIQRLSSAHQVLRSCKERWLVPRILYTDWPFDLWTCPVHVTDFSFGNDWFSKANEYKKSGFRDSANKILWIVRQSSKRNRPYNTFRWAKEKEMMKKGSFNQVSIRTKNDNFSYIYIYRVDLSIDNLKQTK